jgi:predicted esterase
MTRLFAALTAVCMLGQSVAVGENFDYSASPSGPDNYLEASFRFVPAEGGETPQAVLIFVPGTDGDARNMAADQALLAGCRSCHAALLTCYFRGEGLHYDVPSGGTARALEEALSYFGNRTGKPQLIHVPILLLGYSQGAQFVFNFICHPSHAVAAFAAIKPGLIVLRPQQSSFQIPGIIVAGENDEPGRIRTAAKAFSWASGKNSKWAFLFEKNSGHELDRVRDFALAFLVASSLSTEPKSVVYAGCDNPSNVSPLSALSGVCSFPNQKIMQEWRDLHQYATLSSLISLPDRPRMAEAVQAYFIPDHFACENGEEGAATLTLSSIRPGARISHLSIVGPSFSLEEAQEKSLPMQTKVFFRPKNFAWGPVSASVTVEGEVDGRQADPLEISFNGTVQGPVRAVPSLVYLGVSPPDQAVSRMVILRSSGTFRIGSIQAPSDILTALEAGGSANGETRLRIKWTPGKRYGVRTDKIRIHVAFPQDGEVDIPVLGVVSKPVN